MTMSRHDHPEQFSNYPRAIAIIGALTALLSLMMMVPYMAMETPDGFWRSVAYGLGTLGFLSFFSSGAMLFWLGMRKMEH